VSPPKIKSTVARFVMHCHSDTVNIGLTYAVSMSTPTFIVAVDVNNNLNAKKSTSLMKAMCDRTRARICAAVHSAFTNVDTTRRKKIVISQDIDVVAGESIFVHFPSESPPSPRRARASVRCVASENVGNRTGCASVSSPDLLTTCTRTYNESTHNSNKQPTITDGTAVVAAVTLLFGENIDIKNDDNAEPGLGDDDVDVDVDVIIAFGVALNSDSPSSNSHLNVYMKYINTHTHTHHNMIRYIKRCTTTRTT
jgi:hypothetical protein